MANYDHKPPNWNANGDGSFTYRWNIQESVKEDFGHEGENAARTSWDCDEVVIWPTLDKSKLVAAVLTYLWSSDYEAKLVNDYNAARMGSLGAACITKYEEFIKQRKAVKRAVERDYREIFGIERTLEDAIGDKLAAVEDYDTSLSVNSFLVNDFPAWIDKEARSVYAASLESAKKLGEEAIDIDLSGMFITLPLAHAEMMLASIQRYADKSSIVTARHKQAINALTNIAEVDAYDHTANYPEKISLTI